VLDPGNGIGFTTASFPIKLLSVIVNLKPAILSLGGAFAIAPPVPESPLFCLPPALFPIKVLSMIVMLPLLATAPLFRDASFPIKRMPLIAMEKKELIAPALVAERFPLKVTTLPVFLRVKSEVAAVALIAPPGDVPCWLPPVIVTFERFKVAAVGSLKRPNSVGGVVPLFSLIVLPPGLRPLIVRNPDGKFLLIERRASPSRFNTPPSAKVTPARSVPSRMFCAGARPAPKYA